MGRAHRVSEGIHAGTVWINTHLMFDAALQGWPRVDLDPAESGRLRHGHSNTRLEETWTGRCRVYDDLGRLAALGERTGDGIVRPSRVFVFDRD